MSDRYAVVTLDELVPYETEDQARWHTIRRMLGIQAFGMNAWSATEDGQRVIGEHDEADGEQHEEVYVVVSGSATFTLDGESFDAPAGTIVHVPDPAVEARGSRTCGTTISRSGRNPVSYSHRRPGRGRPRHSASGDREWDKAIAMLEEQLAETPDSGVTVYNLACAFAATVGGTRRSRGSEAVTMEDRFLEMAQTDDDLASIRDDPSFPRP